MKAAGKNHTEIALALISAGAHVSIADQVRKLCFCGDLGYYFSGSYQPCGKPVVASDAH